MQKNKKFIIKSENKIKDTGGGFKKDNPDGKVRYNLIPFEPLLRLAQHFTNGGKKYGFYNWKKAKTQEQIEGFREAAERHLHQWVDGQTDEDHASACITNIMMYEWLTNHRK